MSAPARVNDAVPAVRRLPPIHWSQSRFGRAVDMLDPRADEVDFHEIALTLAHIPRFNACTEKPVSVAQHTLIAALAAPPQLRPWVLLHDAHEARLGDIITPVVRTLDALFRRLAPGSNAPAPGAVLHHLKHRHDTAIHAAAGLPMPTPEQRLAIADADRRALVSERRDFCARPPLSWGKAIENTPPLPTRARMRAPLDIADELMAAFVACLPALQGTTR